MHPPDVIVARPRSPVPSEDHRRFSWNFGQQRLEISVSRYPDPSAGFSLNDLDTLAIVVAPKHLDQIAATLADIERHVDQSAQILIRNPAHV